MSHTPHEDLSHRKLNRLWIVVADGGAARILAVSEDRSRIEVIREMVSTTMHLKTHDLVSDRAGRSFESSSPTRHAIVPKHDPHMEEKHRFIQSLADLLGEENRAGRFDQLILIVTPAQVKVLQDGLDPPTRARVRETITKDLTKEAPNHVWGRLIEAGLLPPRAGAPGSRGSQAH
jgi:protein required for attachment to host cells